MQCPKCKGEGYHREYVDLGIVATVEAYEWVRYWCLRCKGKGYLTPEEAGLEKF